MVAHRITTVNVHFSARMVSVAATNVAGGTGVATVLAV